MEKIENMISLFPYCISSSLKISKKDKKKGIYYSLKYYVGVNRKAISGYFTDEELKNHIENIEKEKSNFTDIFTIDKTELTPDIIKYFRYVEPFIEYPSQNVLIDPYILGVWLGDGDSCRPTLTNVDIPTIEAWCAYAEKEGLHINKAIHKETRTGKMETNQTPYVAVYHIVKKKGTGQGKWNKLKEKLKHYDLLYNKHIPDDYLLNDVNVRSQVLAGLIDTDGTRARGAYEITQKNKKLSENIVSLCKSLGFYTTIKEVEKSCMYKGEKRTGTYYRMTISLNQFSKEVPVLIKRKSWKYTGQPNICSPSVDINGNVICRANVRTTWDESMKIKLYSIVEKMKEIQPGRPVSWVIVKEYDERFKDTSLAALNTMYVKTLIPKKNEYDELKIDIVITEYDLISIEWRKRYEEVKDKLDNNSCLTRGNDETLYNWLYAHQPSLSRNCGYTELQKTLWNELSNKQHELTEENDLLEWKPKLDELRKYIMEHQKRPVEGSCLRNWLRSIIHHGCGININHKKKQLWEELLIEYRHIIFDNERVKKVKVIYPNRTEKIFDAINSSIREIGLGLSRSILAERLETGNDFKGHYFYNV